MDISIDFSGLAQAIWNAFLTGITAIVSPLPMDFEQWLLTTLQSLLSAQDGLNLLTHVPTDWTTRDSDVATLSRQAEVLVAAGGVAVLVCAIQCFRVMSGKIDVYEAVGRTAFFVIVGNSVLLWADHIFDLFNAASDVVSSSSVNLADEPLPGAIEMGVMLIVAVVFAIFAWIKGAVGVVFLKVLLVSAPFMIVLSALPVLEGLGTWWAEEFTTWTLRPFMVALVMRLGLGLMARQGGLLGLLFAIVAMWLAYTMDTRIRRLSVGAWGSVGQLSLFARGARFAAGAFGGGAPAATAAAAAPATAAASVP